MSVANPVHTAVRDHYAELARSSGSCCGGNSLYDAQLLKELPADVSSFSLGCGDPITLATLRPGLLKRSMPICRARATNSRPVKTPAFSPSVIAFMAF